MKRTLWSKVFMDAQDDEPNSYAIKTDGTLWAWGRNNEWEIGQGNVSRSSPIQVGSLTTWQVIVGDLGITL